MKYDLAIFDFDGTLFDSGPGLRFALGLTLQKFGYNLSHYKINSFVGPPLEESLQTALKASPAKAREMAAFFRPLYKEKGEELCFFYDGMKELLIRLQKARANLAIASLKSQAALERILSRNSATSFFTAVYGAQSSQKPLKSALITQALQNVPHEKAVMIGDRFIDMQGAQACGLPFIAAGYGYSEQGELDTADFYAASVEQLGALLFA